MITNINLYVAVAMFDEYAGGGLVSDAVTEAGINFSHKAGFAFGVMSLDNAVLSTATLALASILPAAYEVQVTIHCRHEILHSALILQNLPSSVALQKLQEWAVKFKALWFSSEGEDDKFVEALGLATEAATKQRNYDGG